MSIGVFYMMADAVPMGVPLHGQDRTPGPRHQ
jgi:hypothetical protein